MIKDAPLRIVREADVLPPLDAAGFRRAVLDGGQGRVAVETGGCLAHEMASLAGALGGDAASGWGYSEGATTGETTLCLVRDQLCFPAFGVLVDRHGQVLHAPAHEALHRWPTLACLPGSLPSALAGEGGCRLTPPRDPPRLAAAAVFQPWGGNFNYGHFLLDALPSLVAIEEFGLMDRFPPIAPPLKPWQRDLLSLAFGTNPVREIAAPVVRLEAAVYATSMDHFLHAPNALLDRTRQRILQRAPAPRTAGRRLYLSRRGQSMRVMVNEADLERALRTRGFEVIHPERLPVASQIQRMREAAVVVGATGAALANTLFAPDQTQVIEIQPENFASRWVWNTCRQAGGAWRGYVCRSPLEPSAVAWRHRLRRGFKFGYRLPLDDFLAFLDAKLGAPG